MSVSCSSSHPLPLAAHTERQADSNRICLGFLRNTISIQILIVFMIRLGEILLRLFHSKHRLLPHHSFPAYCLQTICHAPEQAAGIGCAWGSLYSGSQARL